MKRQFTGQRVQISAEGGTRAAFFFTVDVDKNGYLKAEQVEALPSEDHARISVLDLPQADVALVIYWLFGKPAPTSALRREGLLSVIAVIEARVPELKLLDLGISHAPDATVTLHPTGGDS